MIDQKYYEENKWNKIKWREIYMHIPIVRHVWIDGMWIALINCSQVIWSLWIVFQLASSCTMVHSCTVICMWNFNSQLENTNWTTSTPDASLSQLVNSYVVTNRWKQLFFSLFSRSSQRAGKRRNHLEFRINTYFSWICAFKRVETILIDWVGFNSVSR